MEAILYQSLFYCLNFSFLQAPFRSAQVFETNEFIMSRFTSQTPPDIPVRLIDYRCYSIEVLSCIASLFSFKLGKLFFDPLNQFLLICQVVHQFGEQLHNIEWVCKLPDCTRHNPSCTHLSHIFDHCSIGEASA